MEDRVVSVDHEYFIFSVDQHHVPAGGEDVVVITRYQVVFVLVTVVERLSMDSYKLYEVAQHRSCDPRLLYHSSLSRVSPLQHVS